MLQIGKINSGDKQTFSRTSISDVSMSKTSVRTSVQITTIPIKSQTTSDDDTE